MSALNNAPLVELGDVFEADDFVGPPPPNTSDRLSDNKDTDPLLRPAASTRARAAAPQLRSRTSPVPPTPNTNVASSEPGVVIYTPRHPSRIASPPHAVQTRRRARTALAGPPSSQPNPSDQSLFRNPYQPSNNNQTQAQPSRPTVPTTPRTDPVPARNSAPNGPRFGQSASFIPPPLSYPTMVPRPVQASWRRVAPPSSSSVNLNNIIASSRMTHAPINNNRTSIPLLQSSSSNRPPRPAHQNRVPNFQQQAIPVRSPLEDFLRHVQLQVPGCNPQALLNQIITNPHLPIELPVPPGVNTELVQQQLQQLLEATMFQVQQLHQQTARIRPPTPQMAPLSYADNLQYSNMTLPMAPMNGTSVHDPAFKSVPLLPRRPPPSEDEMAKQDVDADINQDDDYHEIETYADYVPTKLPIGKPHPDPVVETSSLSSVEPPDVHYNLKLPKKLIDEGLLSALQLESVVYACQQHELFLADKKTRRGFLIGDGAGVGKGRTIAGIIYENYLCGRKKAIWLSVSLDLKLDAERDLKDIGAKIPVSPLKNYTYGRRIDLSHGVLFTTYSGLVSKSQSVRGNLGSRLGQIVSWVGAEFDGCIVFDECHKAKNITAGKTAKSQSKAAMFAVEIQDKLPNARIVYASATGASETKHLGYMVRLGMWGLGTPYPRFADFCTAIEKRGVGAMELVAVDLKMRGSYIARQLSFKTTSFKIRIATLDQEFIDLYDKSVDMWSKALEYFSEAAQYLRGNKKKLRTLWASFWAAHQKFFKYLCIGAKVPLVVEVAKQALAQDKCVVIGLQTTGESKTLEALEDGDINEFVSTARATFESLVDNHFPAPQRPRKTKPVINLPFFAKQSSSAESNSVKSSPPLSSSPSLDEQWHSHDGVKFSLNSEGKVTARLDDTKVTEKSEPKARKRFHKNQKILDDLVADKRKMEQGKKLSVRTLRAKRRTLARTGEPRSRIRKPDGDSSDDSLSSEEIAHASDSTYKGDDGSSETTTSDESAATMIDASDAESVVERKRSRKTSVGPKKNMLASDSDSDIEITDVIVGQTASKTSVSAKAEHEVIILDTDDDGLDDDLGIGDDDDAGPGDDDDEDPIKENAEKLSKMRDDMLDTLDAIAPLLPNNTLDELIDRLGGPSEVAEMTGRKGRIVKDSYGRVSYKQRNEDDALERLNIAERERFMDGTKLVAIISEAASSGISLQSDKRVANKRRRVHITIELPWSADRAIQQFGRTHRSNQISGPEYVFVISELSGEKRFASVVAKRLESLGALTHGDRRANTDTRDLSQFNIVSRYCKQALEILCRNIEFNSHFADIKPDYQGDFFGDARKAFMGVGMGKLMGSHFTADLQALKVTHFLNRLLGMKVGIQNAIFKLFTEYMDRLIVRKKVAGLYDSGILELNSESGKTRCAPPEHFNLRTMTGDVKCTLRRVQVERGISWEEANSLLSEEKSDPRSGFYIAVNPLTKSRMVFLLIREPSLVDKFKCFKPNTGRSPKLEFFSSLTERSQPASPEEAEHIWRKVFKDSDTKCVHMCYFNSCKRLEAQMKCDVGMRHRNYCILSGGVLTAWPYLEFKAPEVTAKLQIVRLKLDDSNRVIGPIIQQDAVDFVRSLLKKAESDGVVY